jgi:hypothetical protein
MKINLIEEKEENTCKGLVFRAYQNYFHHNNRFEEKRGFRLLKRESCLGCEFCWNLYDHVKEVLANYDELPVDEVDSFKKYTVVVSGCDGEDIEFVPIESK